MRNVNFNVLLIGMDKTEIKKIASSFIPPAVLDRALSNPEQLNSMGDRRRVTILFADLSGFTPLVENNDAEYVLFLINELFDKMLGVVHHYDGTIDKFLGDAIMVLFGAPLVHEDDPLRAMLCAIDLMKAVRAFSKERSIDLDLTIGINTGSVVSGLVGNEQYREYTVLGNAVNIASRFEYAASKGSILVGESTFTDYEEYFVYKELEPIMVKGVSKPQKVFEIKAKKRENSDIDIKISSDSVFIGDNELLEQLNDYLAKNEKLSLVIHGEAGSGKSFISNLLKKKIISKGYRPYIIHGYSWQSKKSYGSLQTLFQFLLGVVDIDTDDVEHHIKNQLTKIKIDCDIDNLTHHLCNISLNDSRDYTVSGSTLDLPIEMILNNLIRLERLVIIFDDFDQYDRHSKELVLKLASTCDCIIVSREYSKSFDQFTTFEVKKLARKAIRNATSYYFKRDDIPSELVNYIEKLSYGLVGNIVLLLEYLLKNDLIILKDKKVELREDSNLPVEIESLMTSSIDNLETKFRQAIIELSVLGNSFPKVVMKKMLENSEKTTEELLNSDFFVQSNENQNFDDSNEIISYKWQALRYAAYYLLLDIHKKQLHKKAAEIYKGIFGNNPEYYHVIADHFCFTDNRKNTYNYAQLSGFHSVLHNNNDSLVYFERALSFTNEEINNWGFLENLYSVCTEAGRLYWMSGELNKTIRVNLRASRIARLLDNRTFLARSLNGIAIALEEKGKYKLALQMYQKAYFLIEKENHEKPLLLQLTNNIGVLLSEQDKIDAALEVYNSMKETASQNPRWAGSPTLFSSLGWVNRKMGKLDDAVENYKTALQMDMIQNNSHGEAIDRLNIAAIFIDMNKLEDAKRELLIALPIFYKIREIRGRINTLNALGEVFRLMLNYTKAVKTHHLSSKLAEKINDKYAEYDSVIELARDYITLREYDSVSNLLARLQALSSQIGEEEYISEVSEIETLINQ